MINLSTLDTTQISSMAYVSIANAFASTFYFLANIQDNAKKIKRACKPPHRTQLTCTDTTLNVNRFEQSDYKLGTTRLLTERRTADNN